MCFCVRAGVLAAYFMRWLQVGRCSPAPRWKTSCTSSSGYWVSDSWKPARFSRHVFNHTRHNPVYLTDCDSLTTGTPKEENWPGISSIEEFKSHNFPKYKPQPLINHAPRYRDPAFLDVCTNFCMFLLYAPVARPFRMYTIIVCVCVCVSQAGNPVEHFTHRFLPPMSPHIPVR